MIRGSRVFDRNKALGFVSNDVPLVVRYIGTRNENLIVTCVGKAFHTYGCNRFGLLSVSNIHSHEITCLAGDNYHIYTSCNNIIYAWRRGTELKHTYEGHSKPVHIIVPIGPNILSVDEDSVIKVWDVKSEEEVLEFPFSNLTFEITCVLHPSTYLNKMLLGSKQGQLQLLNIHTSKLIYTFRGWNSEVTVLEQAPAIDVVAIGLANGKIILHNIKYDKTVVDFTQNWGFVTTIAFRSDGLPVMITGSLSGHITLWNLEEKNSIVQLSAHNRAVTGMKCLLSEPLMVTSSPDNSLKLWIFDMSDGGPRILRSREGHASPPTYIRYRGSNGHNILSAGGDSTLRVFSTVTEILNKSLGVAYRNRKTAMKVERKEREHLRMPPIIYFSSETAREKDWDDTAAIHDGLGIVTTWSCGKGKMGLFKLRPKSFSESTANNRITPTCLCLSSCGSFVIVGYSCGDVHKFNIQSGLHRGGYGDLAAHKGPVRGVASDALNRIVVSAGSDAVLKFWAFETEVPIGLLSTVKLEDSVLSFDLHRESSLLAISLEDYQVIVVDLDTRIVIRKFVGHSAKVTDMTWSPDARWLITASMDCTVRTWDIPSAHLIDIFQVDVPCISLSFSPSGDRLATVHVNELGIFLWANRTLFEKVHLRPILDVDTLPIMSLPTTGENVAESEVLKDEDNEDLFKSPDQISGDLVTLSLFSKSRWQNLLDMDVIQRRNKPLQPLTKPKNAPFFIPTIPALEFQFDLSERTSGAEEGKTPLPFSASTSFGKLLKDSVETGDFQFAIEKLKDLGPSAITFEVESLSVEGGGSEEAILQFMKLLETMLVSNQNFELAQAYLGLFLKKHGAFITEKEELFAQLAVLQECQRTSWKTLQNKLLYSMCVVESLKIM